MELNILLIKNAHKKHMKKEWNDDYFTGYVAGVLAMADKYEKLEE